MQWLVVILDSIGLRHTIAAVFRDERGIFSFFVINDEGAIYMCCQKKSLGTW